MPPGIMTSVMRGVALASAVVVAAAAVTIRAARAKWERTSSELADRIAAREGMRAPADPAVLRYDSLTSLPLPVQRYFRATLREGQRPIRVARLESTGSFRQVAPGAPLGPDEGWMPFTARQTFTADPPGLVWSARMRMMHVVPVQVRDGYVRGRGSMQAAALGLFQVANEQDTPELNAGALLRFLAESPWLPTALLPREHLTWAPVDEGRARATLRDGATEVSAVFEFSPTGDIVAVTAERPMSVGTGYLVTPWRGRFWQHEMREGMRIPLRGEVSWLLDGTWQPYWRGRIVRTEYDLVPAAGGVS